jgi:RNA polymerase sigma-70 factor (ECF subfamily)
MVAHPVIALSLPRPSRPDLLGSKTAVSLDPVIQRAQAGDQAAFRELFQRHRGEVGRIVFRVIGPSPDVDDVVQEVFVHVYRSIRSFRGESKFSTWLYRLTVNVSRMHLRRGRSRPQIADVPVPERSRDDEGLGDGSPEHAVERAERVRTLYRVLEGLTEKKRTVLVLHDLEGMAAKDIADVVGAPILTVRTRLFYARKELYAAIAKEPTLQPVMEALLAKLPGRPELPEVVPVPVPAVVKPAAPKRPTPAERAAIVLDEVDP